MSLIILAVLIVIVFGFISIYNSLIRLKNQIDRAWSNIEVILKQRFDEIPQLVQVLEQFVNYENQILSKLMEARTHYSSAKTVKDKMGSSEDMSLAFQGLLALSESYPELKSNENFRQLQNRVSDLEHQLSDRRETYNDSVTNFNTRIEQIPDVLVARIFNYTSREMFQVSEHEMQKPSLQMKLPNS